MRDPDFDRRPIRLRTSLAPLGVASLAALAACTVAQPQATAKVVYYAGGAASANATATDASGAYLVTNAPFAVFGVGWSNAAGAMVGGLSPDLKIGAVTTILYHPTD